MPDSLGRFTSGRRTIYCYMSFCREICLVEEILLYKVMLEDISERGEDLSLLLYHVH